MSCNESYVMWFHIHILTSTVASLNHHGPLARYVKLRVRMRRECRERFPRHRRWAIPTCITARASRTCRDACRDRQLSVSFEIGGGGNVPGIPGACATCNFTYLVRGPWKLCTGKRKTLISITKPSTQILGKLLKLVFKTSLCILQ